MVQKVTEFFAENADDVLFFLEDGKEHAIEVIRAIRDETLAFPDGRTIAIPTLDVVTRNKNGCFSTLSLREICDPVFKRAFPPVTPIGNHDSSLPHTRKHMILVRQNPDIAEQMEAIRRLNLRDNYEISTAAMFAHFCDLAEVSHTPETPENRHVFASI